MMSSNDPTVQVGDFDVLHSGSVITYGELPVKFKLGTLQVEFLFKSGTEGELDASLEFEELDQHRIRITFQNFLGSLMGSTQPVQMGTFNQRPLYLNYIVTTVNPKVARLLNFTFYIGVQITGKKQSVASLIMGKNNE